MCNIHHYVTIKRSKDRSWNYPENVDGRWQEISPKRDLKDDVGRTQQREEMNSHIFR